MMTRDRVRCLRSGLLAPGAGTLAALLLLVMPFTAVRGETPDTARQHAILAQALATPLLPDIDDVTNSHSDGAVMVRMEIARQRLQGLQNLPEDAARAREKLLGKLDAMHLSMERIRRLRADIPDVEGIAKAALNAGPAGLKSLNDQPLNDRDKQARNDFLGTAMAEIGKGLVNAYQAREERQAYNEAYSAARRLAITELTALCRSRYATSKVAENAISVRVVSSWNNLLWMDHVRFRNDSDQDLTNVTLIVEVEGVNAKTGEKEWDRHLHHIDRWPNGKWRYAGYPSRARDGIATNQSVDSIEKVSVTMYSNECRSTRKYTYAGAEYDDIVKHFYEKCAKPKITGQWFYYVNDHPFYNSGFEVSFGSEWTKITVSHITITVNQGNRSESLRWKIRDGQWAVGDKKWFSDKRFNSFDEPNSVTILLEFPGSSFTKKMEFEYKR